MEEQKERKAISVGDIQRRCNDAASKMSNHNPHKVLLLTCAHALGQLVERLDAYENPKRVM